MLVRCAECGKPVSTNAVSCPHCGNQPVGNCAICIENQGNGVDDYVQLGCRSDRLCCPGFSRRYDIERINFDKKTYTV